MGVSANSESVVSELDCSPQTVLRELENCLVCEKKTHNWCQKWPMGYGKKFFPFNRVSASLILRIL